MPTDPEFPATSAMTESAITAMLRAERCEAQVAQRVRTRRLRRAALVSLITLGIGAPTALAVKAALTADEVPAKVVVMDPRTGKIKNLDIPGFVVAEGTHDRLSWTIYARRCEVSGRVSIADAAAISDRPRSEPGSVSLCTNAKADPDQPGTLRPSGAVTSSTRGMTLVYGFVPTRATRVEVTVTPYGDPDRSQKLALPVAPLPPALVERARLPSGYGLYHADLDGDLQIVRAEAEDVDGSILLTCTPGGCHQP